jgi:cellulose synthase/poly-beta-1,6-N-acetylglucosamine synthase-like glycosyltransferase
MVKNLVRPRGLARLGLPCLLTGTGMAFPWEIARKITLLGGSIVEDMQLGIDLALSGHPPTFCEEASVVGRLPAGAAAAKMQRRRWEHGHLRTAISQAPRLFFRSLFCRQWVALVLLLDLCVPPMSLLMILSVLATAFTTWAAICVGASHLPAVMLASSLCCVLVCVVAAWLRFGRHAMPVGSVLGAPRYALAKVPLYASFVHRRQREWVRTPRDDNSPEPTPLPEYRERE